MHAQVTGASDLGLVTETPPPAPWPKMPCKSPLFFKKDKLHLLDQKALPHKIRYVACDGAQKVAQAIKDMTIRGAPLIGQAACWGLYLDLRRATKNKKQWDRVWHRAYTTLKEARPTAVNLVGAMEGLGAIVNNDSDDPAVRLARIQNHLMQQQNYWQNLTNRLAHIGARVLRPGSQVLTHCNTGRLATLGRGTALAVIEEGFRRKKIGHVFATETRPYLQGARLTMWELKQMGIPATLITDGMVAHLMATKKIHAVFVGCDRVARNGDTANKIGTLGIAVLARHYGIAFYVAGPKENIDPATATGKNIPIEERNHDEINIVAGRKITPPGTKAWHPAFDVTPHDLITGIITEEGIWDPNKKTRPAKIPAAI